MSLDLVATFNVDRVITDKPSWQMLASPASRILGYQWYKTSSPAAAVQGVVRAGLWDAATGTVVDSADVVLGSVVHDSVIVSYGTWASCNLRSDRSVGVIRAEKAGEQRRFYVVLADQTEVRSAVLTDWDWLFAAGGVPPAMTPALPTIDGYNPQVAISAFRVDDNTFGIVMQGSFYDETTPGSYTYYNWPFWRTYNWADFTPASAWQRADIAGRVNVDGASTLFHYLVDSLYQDGTLRLLFSNDGFDAYTQMVINTTTGAATESTMHADVRAGVGADTYINDGFFNKGNGSIGVYYYDEVSGNEYLKILALDGSVVAATAGPWAESNPQMDSPSMSNELLAQDAFIGTDGSTMFVVEGGVLTESTDVVPNSPSGNAFGVFGPDNLILVANNSDMGVSTWQYVPPVTVLTTRTGASRVRWS